MHSCRPEALRIVFRILERVAQGVTENHEISETLVNRFAGTFAKFTAAVEDAVSQAGLDPEFAGTVQFQAWQRQALPYLQQQNASIQKAVAHFLIGDMHPIVQFAAEKRGLSKQLDGFLLTFVGPEQAKILDRLETAVVVAAYQLCVAAGVP